MPCKGNPSETCGGPGRLSLYVAKDLESLEPCGYVPPSSSSSTTSTTSSTSSTSSTVPPTTSTTSTTSTPYTKPPTTSPTSTSTTKPPTTTTPPTTSKTTSICYATTTVPSTCEYGCGKWCNKELPDWNDQTSCKTAVANCKIQLAACFKSAGWPASMDCFDFADWCSDIDSYCAASPYSVKGYGKKDCFSKKPPKGGNPPTTKTITIPCAPTTTAKPTTTSKPATTTTACPIPTVTNICKQPTNPKYGYKPGNPVGGIQLPVVTCNDLKNDFNQKPFKLYTDSDSSKCGAYTRPQCSDACADACKAQYDQCVGTYAKGCQSTGGKSSPWNNKFGAKHRMARSELQSVAELEKRTGGGWYNDYNGATNNCKAQYGDCLTQNQGVTGSGKCYTWGSGW